MSVLSASRSKAPLIPIVTEALLVLLWGMMSVINAIPDNWLQPLHVTLETNISGMGKIDIDALDSVVNK